MENLVDDPALRVDLYLRRPFTFDDLREALVAVLRRRHHRDDKVVRIGDLLIDPPRRKVTIGDEVIHLSKKEFLLLRVLATDPTRVFSKDELLLAVWGLRSPTKTTRTLDSHSSRLRRKLDPESMRFVVNCWGIGYRLVDSKDEAELTDSPDESGRAWATANLGPTTDSPGPSRSISAAGPGGFGATRS